MTDDIQSEDQHTEQTEEQQEQEPSLRDKLLAVYDKMEQGEAPAESQAAAEEDDSDPDAKTEAEAEADAEDQPEAEQPDEDDQTSESAPDPIEGPAGWSEDERAEYAKLPPEVQQIVARRESERDKTFSEKTQELAESRKGREQLDAVVDHFGEYITKGIGTTAHQAFQTLLGAEHRLRTGTPAQKREMIQALADQYGVEGLTFQDQPSQTDEGIYADPKVTALESSVNEVKTTVQSFVTDQQKREASALQQQLEAFRDEVDAKGNPTHPHFDRLFNSMASLAQAGQAKSYQDAYDKALRLDDELWQQEQEKQRAAAAAEDKVSKAKAKAKTNLPRSRQAKAETEKPKSRRDRMLDVYDEMTSAG